MKIYDISQEVFGCRVFSGDRIPQRYEDKKIDNGDLYNLTSIVMCTHNGTHIDAPFHFLNDGICIDGIPLEKTVGYCYITSENSDITGKRAEEILNDAKALNFSAAKRILIKGNGTVTDSAAAVFADAGIYLIGVEGQTVGPIDAPMSVHKTLLKKDVVLLEGICLNAVNDGIYFLNAAPLNLSGSDGAPCRAILISDL